MLCLRLESLAPTEESLCWAHSAVGHDGSAREAPRVSDKDSSVGARAWSVEDGFARRLPQNDSDRPYTLFLRVRHETPAMSTDSAAYAPDVVK
jgi:hypothetical protein